MGIVKERNKLCYIEPNDIPRLNKSSNFDNIVWNPEDLNFGIDLQVVKPSVWDYGKIDYQQIANNSLFGSKTSDYMRSFFQGTNIKNGSFLTTSYLDISYSEIQSNKVSDRECLGVDSIEITLDKNYFPEVHISLTDVKGYSLFMPAQYSYGSSSNGTKDRTYYNFFRALFTIPYPNFILSVKGYYGHKVSFMLSVQSVKSVFDSQTGSFKVNIDFVGFLYGIYSEIPFNFILIAPYIDGIGSYWETKRGNEFSYYSKGSCTKDGEMKTFAEYVGQYNNMTAILQNNGAFKSATDITTIETEKQLLSDYKSARSDFDNFIKALKNKNYPSIYCKPIEKDIEVSGSNIAGTSIEEHYLFFKNGDNRFEIDKTKLPSISKYVNKKESDGFKDILRINGLSISTYLNSDYIEEDKTKIKIENGKIIINSDLTYDPNKFLELNPENFNISDYSHIIDIEYYKFNLYSSQDIDNLENKNLDGQLDEIKDTLNLQIANAMGFFPSIANVYRMTFAHLECFLNAFYTTIDKIKELKRRPFPCLTKKDEDGNNTYMYIGESEEEQYQNSPEEELVDKIVKAAFDYSAKVNEKIASQNGDALTYYATSMMDYYYNNTNPYSTYSGTSNGAYNKTILMYFLHRFIVSYTTIGKYRGTQGTYGDEDTIIKTIAVLEAKNYLMVNPTAKEGFTNYLTNLVGAQGSTTRSATDVCSGIQSEIEDILGKRLAKFQMKNNSNQYVTSTRNNGHIMIDPNYLVMQTKDISFNTPYYFSRDGVTDNCGDNAEERMLRGSCYILSDDEGPKFKAFIDSMSAMTCSDITLGENASSSGTQGDSGNTDNSLTIGNLFCTFLDSSIDYMSNAYRECGSAFMNVNSGYEHSRFFSGKANNVQGGYMSEDHPLKRENCNRIKYVDYYGDRNYGNIKNVVEHEFVNEYNPNKCVQLRSYWSFYEKNPIIGERSWYEACETFLSCIPYRSNVLYNALIEEANNEKGKNINYVPEVSNLIICQKSDLLTLAAHSYLGVAHNAHNMTNTFVKDGYTTKLSPAVKKMLHKYFCEWANSNTFKKIRSLILNENQYEVIKGATDGNEDISEYYSSLSEGEKLAYRRAYYIIKPNSELEKALINFYKEDVYIYVIGNSLEISDNRYVVPSCMAITTFGETLLSAYDKVSKETQTSSNQTINKIASNDEKLAIYTSLRILYEKWICGYNRERFYLKTIEKEKELKDKRYNLKGDYQYKTDEHLEINNFLYVDSYYNDIGYDFPVNPELFYNAIIEQSKSTNNFSVLEFLSFIAQKNSLLFVALPLYNCFYNAKALEDAFTPQRWDNHYLGMGNTFIIMYTSEPAKIIDTGKDILNNTDCEYKDDGFSLLPSTNNECLKLLKNNNNYGVSAFGVSYGIQNQSYFKNISINTSNPRTTDYGIVNIFDLAHLGGAYESQVHGIGQDVFSIYSNRAYNCSIDMLGCANIMPMMYFELNNIPMFNGAYLITKVKHSIKAGDFSTSFEGTRISKNSHPLNADLYRAKMIIELITNNENRLNSGFEDVNAVSSTAEENVRGKYIMECLMNTCGFTKEQAIGVGGALYHESNWSSKSLNSKSHAAGIGQWLGERRKYIVEYVNSHYDKNYENSYQSIASMTLEEQTYALCQEVNNQVWLHHTYGEHIKKTTTAEDACKEWVLKFERSDDAPEHYLKYITNARNAMN